MPKKATSIKNTGYQVSPTLEREQRGTFPCFTLEAANYVTAKLNKKKIAYYSYFSEDCWIIKFDKSEGWMGRLEELF